MKRPRLRGFPRELKLAAELFRRDHAAGSARLAGLREYLSHDYDVLLAVVLHGLTASTVERMTGEPNKKASKQIRYVLAKTADFYVQENKPIYGLTYHGNETKPERALQGKAKKTGRCCG